MAEWKDIHSQERSWRQKILGDESADYVLGRYLRIFAEAFCDSPPSDFLELGSGNGDLSRLILNSHFDFIRRYVTSECFPDGVAWLRQRGLESLLLDAENIDLPDESFDVVISFDVMHHVDNPRNMAREMVRVSRGKLLLTEANGFSLGRKIMELTPGHRKAGEQSYAPFTYLRFFRSVPGIRIIRYAIYPFLFMVKAPGFLVPVLTAFSSALERIPLFKWQCANVAIYMEFERI